MTKHTTRYYWILCLTFVVIAGSFNVWLFKTNIEESIIRASVEVTLAFTLAFGLSAFFNIKSQIVSENFQNTILTIVSSVVLSAVLWMTIAFYLYKNIFHLIDIKFLEYIKMNFLIPSLTIPLLLFYLLINDLILLIKTQNKKETELTSLVQSAELKTLKTQLNPHFLFNSLNTINSETFIDVDAAREMIVRLSDFLRFSLDQADHKMIKLESELDNIDRYLNIEKKRFGERLIYEIHTDTNSTQLQLPNLILQPLFENIIKHGVNKNLASTNMKLSAWSDDEALHIIITNSLPQQNNMVTVGTGTGLNTIKKRLSLLYKKDDLIKVVKRNQNFEVKLKFPQTYEN